VEYGEMAGIPTPNNEALVALIKAAERAARRDRRIDEKEKR
jgi:ketopantoate reductase